MKFVLRVWESALMREAINEVIRIEPSQLDTAVQVELELCSETELGPVPLRCGGRCPSNA